MDLKTTAILISALLPAVGISQYQAQMANPAFAQGPRIHRLSLKDSGARVNLSRGDFVIVDFGALRSNDAEWRLIKNSGNLRLSSESAIPGNRDYYRSREASGSRTSSNVFYFEATGGGSATLEFGCYHGRSRNAFESWRGVFTIDTRVYGYGHDEHYDDHFRGRIPDDRHCYPNHVGVYRATLCDRYGEFFEIVVNLRSRNSAIIVVKEDRGYRRAEYRGIWYSRNDQVIVELDGRGYYGRGETLVFVVRGYDLVPSTGTRHWLGFDLPRIPRLK